jgi:FkbM family methyltransferase
LHKMTGLLRESWWTVKPITRYGGAWFALMNFPDDLRRSLVTKDYESPEVEALKWLNPGLPVVELGACCGVVACLTNRRLRRQEAHIVIEANPKMLPLIERNKELNRSRFTILHRAIAYDAREVSFGIADNPHISSVSYEDGLRVSVPATSVSQVVLERGFQRFSLICDIEGAEVDLIKRELPLLGERVETAIIEFHPHCSGEAEVAAAIEAVISSGFHVPWRSGNVVVFQK